jgi:hypothetical protein
MQPCRDNVTQSFQAQQRLKEKRSKPVWSVESDRMFNVERWSGLIGSRAARQRIAVIETDSASPAGRNDYEFAGAQKMVEVKQSTARASHVPILHLLLHQLTKFPAPPLCIHGLVYTKTMLQLPLTMSLFRQAACTQQPFARHDPLVANTPS